MAETEPAAGLTDQQLMIFTNPDKLNSRPAFVGPAAFSLPARVLFAGPPGVGKRNMILNVIFKLDPKPSAIHIVHFEPDTREYEVLEKLGIPMFYYGADSFPTFENIQNPAPVAVGEGGDGEPDEAPIDPRAGDSPLVIIDELTSEQLGREGSARMERLLNYGSSHKNTTVMCSIQAITNIPPRARRGFNQFCLWKQQDQHAADMAAARCGVPTQMLRELFELCTNRHDSIWVDTDRSPDSEWRFRLNFLTPITATSAVPLE